MTVTVSVLQQDLEGRSLPGGRVLIDAHESFIADAALRAEPDLGAPDAAHPVWFVIASLRGLGVSVEELCVLAHQEEGDTLLLGRCRVDQRRTLRTGQAYLVGAQIRQVGSRRTRDGARLDSVEVVVRLREESPDDAEPADGLGAGVDAEVGTVTTTYLFKRKVVQ